MRDLSGVVRQAPRLRLAHPASTTTVPNFGIEPGNPSNTARRFRGFINIPADEVYTIALASDDGSRLRIDGKLVIDHDGLHPLEEKRTSLTLTAGSTRSSSSTSTGGGAALTLKMGKGTDRLAPINDSWLLH